MAKGDSSNINSQIGNTQTGLNTNFNNAMTGLTGVNAGTSGMFGNMYGNYNNAAARNTSDYGNIMGNLGQFLTNRTVGGGGSYAPNTGLTGGPITTQPIGGGVMSGNSTTQPNGGGGVGSVGGGGRLPRMQLDSNNVNTSEPGGGYVSNPGYNPLSALGGGGNPSGPASPLASTGAAPNNGSPQGISLGQSDFGAITPSLTALQGLLPSLSKAQSGYGNFADTGGFSPGDLTAMKGSMMAPATSAFSSAMRNVAQAGALNPTLTNVGAAQGKLAQQQGAATSDAAVNANAAIAQAVQQGKLAGLSGLTGLGTNAANTGVNAGLGGLSNTLGTLNAMTGLYGATPGLMSTTGNQALGANSQNLQGQSLLNQLTLGQGGLNLGLIGAMTGASQVPGNFQSFMGNVGSGLGMLGTLGGIF